MPIEKWAPQPQREELELLRAALRHAGGTSRRRDPAATRARSDRAALAAAVRELRTTRRERPPLQ